MSAKPTTEFDAGQFRFDVEMHDEATHHGLAKTNCDIDPTWIGTISRTTTTPKLESAGLHELKIDESDRVSVSPEPRGGVRALLFNLALGASCCLAWIAASALVPPLGLIWGSGLGVHHFLDANQASSSLRDQKLDSSARIPDSKKGDRLQIVGRSTIDGEREATTKEAESAKSPRSLASRAGKQFLGADPPAPSARKHSTATEQYAAMASGVKDLQSRAELTPTPETKPTTIEGWMVREVDNGVAVLEGPNGIWRATRGETVPELGKVDSIVRWGNRWIVATTKGLISTP
jgi:hypothetical protein